MPSENRTIGQVFNRYLVDHQLDRLSLVDFSVLQLILALLGVQILWQVVRGLWLRKWKKEASVHHLQRVITHAQLTITMCNSVLRGRGQALVSSISERMDWRRIIQLHCAIKRYCEETKLSSAPLNSIYPINGRMDWQSIVQLVRESDGSDSETIRACKLFWRRQKEALLQVDD